jgi:hypothetical protein
VVASEELAAAIEELGLEPAPAAGHGPILQRPVRLALRPLARVAARRAEERKRARKAHRHPEQHLRRRAHNIARHASGAPVVAGPWLGDEIGELLYWIPYLRWAQTASVGVRDRLVVLRRPGSGWWYQGLGADQLDADEIVEEERLPEVTGVEAERYLILHWEEVESRREALATHRPDRRIQRRLLEFEPLIPPAVPSASTLPASFVASRGVDLPLDRPTVSLDDLAPEDAAAVIARADCYVGAYGSEAYVAALLGVPALALRARGDAAAAGDLRLASYVLGRPPFGRLECVPEGDPAALRSALARLAEPVAEGAGAALTAT